MNAKLNNCVFIVLCPLSQTQSFQNEIVTLRTATKQADAAASAAAAAANMKSTHTGSATGNPSLPANSGFVQTANPPIPPSERSKLIRINRELRNNPTVLGGGMPFISGSA
jgi:hypothetical protein